MPAPTPTSTASRALPASRPFDRLSGPLSIITGRDHFPAGARAQGLERRHRHAVADEADGAVGEGEVGAAPIAAAEGAEPILHRGEIAVGRHLVVDRPGAVERDVADALGDETPLPKAGEGTILGEIKGFEALEFRIAMETLAEEE